MPQQQLPLFPDGTTLITPQLGFMREKEEVTYLYGSLPVFIHHVGDLASFHMITAQFVVSGHATQAQIAEAFGVTRISVKRAVKRYREQGAKGFYAPRATRGAAVLTEPVLKEAQQLLVDGMAASAVADQLRIKRDTLDKAIRAGRLQRPQKRTAALRMSSTKSMRTQEDSQAAMGMGATNASARVAASLGRLDAVPPEFVAAADIPCGGVMLAVPALLALGLIDSTRDQLTLPKGYYGLDSLLLLLAFMALARLPSIDALRYHAPGEWGDLLGLDRVPEVRTLRSKIRLLADQGQAESWGAHLSAQWMAATPALAGALYIDGHVRVYHGEQTPLPRHYVARQKLCLRATTDYWVNALDGQPFFVINQVVDPGLLHVLEQEIIPRLERDVPHQPPPEALAAEPLRHRFLVVFDREGYSPGFFSRMRAKRIAILSYHKHPGTDWDDDEFTEHLVGLQNGTRVTMRLAERGTCLSNGLWLREVRKQTTHGHQTAILTTDYGARPEQIASAMFARWSQENFFKYARENYGLDRLADYRTAEITDPIKVVNPAYRALDTQVRVAVGKCARQVAQFGEISLATELTPPQVESMMQTKASLQEQIKEQQGLIESLKAQRKQTPRHIEVKDLPEDQRFKSLATQSKYFLDTIGMLAFRAETAMASLLREHLAHKDETRSQLKAIYSTEADLLPDMQAGTLTVCLHHLANEASNTAVRKLCDELTATQTLFPRSNLRLVFTLGSPQFPRDPEVWSCVVTVKCSQTTRGH
jgi:hypothetical protein